MDDCKEENSAAFINTQKGIKKWCVKITKQADCMVDTPGNYTQLVMLENALEFAYSSMRHIK